jgi:hypothetical protein
MVNLAFPVKTNGAYEHGLVGAKVWGQVRGFSGGSGSFEEGVPLAEKPIE